MHSPETFQNPNAVFVSTIHVLNTGEIIESREGFEKVQERFLWADRKTAIQRILQLRSMTDLGKKSIIVYYEKGHQIKEHINIEANFIPLSF